MENLLHDLIILFNSYRMVRPKAGLFPRSYSDPYRVLLP
ncbi:hypothetical protein ATPR_0912 [Acetobacter tropicalis NBRC 101654]|uniref:Uncharacterized protein n=1 Tax=Acetobacter tropicalis NBRC 101654 TaxID=749388 RepID=F7VC14_9PROT|nr:hypothetical protein ATPR_0912 [Acetobacter tropicalis NBRC 101654]